MHLFFFRKLKIFANSGKTGQLTFWLDLTMHFEFSKRKRTKIKQKYRTKYCTLWKSLSSLHCQWKRKVVDWNSLLSLQKQLE